MEIPLKRKYTQPTRWKKNKHGGDRTGKARRNKLNAAAKRLLPPQPHMVMVLENGRTHMERV